MLTFCKESEILILHTAGSLSRRSRSRSGLGAFAVFFLCGPFQSGPDSCCTSSLNPPETQNNIVFHVISAAAVERDDYLSIIF